MTFQPNVPHPGRRLRDAWKRGTVMVPGAFNALVARAAAQAGFEACYISGGATANVAGYPDIGLITLTEMARTIREIADASKLPVIADADTGYGEVECCIRTVVEYERAARRRCMSRTRSSPSAAGTSTARTSSPPTRWPTRCARWRATASARTS